MWRFFVLAQVFLILSVPAVGTAATLVAKYRWNTNQAVNISVRTPSGDPMYGIDSGEDYDSCGAMEIAFYNSWGTSSLNVTPATSNGAVGVDITIDPFFASPTALFDATPWPNRCEYFPPGPGYLPTTVSVEVYLDNVLVSSGSKDYPVFPGTLSTTPGVSYEVASYPIQPHMLWELDSALGMPQRVLLHKYRQDDNQSGFGGYFSIYQEPQPSVPDPPVMRIAGNVEENSRSVTRDVWLRIVDPPTDAPYEPARRPGDNLDTVSPVLYYIDGNGQRIDSVLSVLHIQSNQDTVPGRVRVHLQASDHGAGDNYQIEASFDPSFTCETAGYNGANICALTTKYTA